MVWTVLIVVLANLYNSPRKPASMFSITISLRKSWTSAIQQVASTIFSKMVWGQKRFDLNQNISTATESFKLRKRIPMNNWKVKIEEFLASAVVANHFSRKEGWESSDNNRKEKQNGCILISNLNLIFSQKQKEPKFPGLLTSSKEYRKRKFDFSQFFFANQKSSQKSHKTFLPDRWKNFLIKMDKIYCWGDVVPRLGLKIKHGVSTS